MTLKERCYLSCVGDFNAPGKLDSRIVKNKITLKEVCLFLFLRHSMVNIQLLLLVVIAKPEGIQRGI